MRFDVLSLFPEMFQGVFEHSIVKIARAKGLVEIVHWNIRDFTQERHEQVDDRPFGGGPGMVLMPDPVFRAVEHVHAQAEPAGRLVMLTPQGTRLTQRVAQELAGHPRLLLLCGHYEGFDERIRIGLEPLELSVGDYVLTGGEIAAMVVIDAVSRLVSGVLGDAGSAADDSFSEEGQLEYPHYTRPRTYRGMSVPDVLLSGNHAAIDRWRREQSDQRTHRPRSGPDGRRRGQLTT